jgi:hypothetical protein
LPLSPKIVSAPPHAELEVVSEHLVVTGTGADRVSAPEAEDLVITAEADDHIGAGSPLQHVVATGANDPSPSTRYR